MLRFEYSKAECEHSEYIDGQKYDATGSLVVLMHADFYLMRRNMRRSLKNTIAWRIQNFQAFYFIFELKQMNKSHERNNYSVLNVLEI